MTILIRLVILLVRIVLWKWVRGDGRVKDDRPWPTWLVGVLLLAMVGGLAGAYFYFSQPH